MEIFAGNGRVLLGDFAIAGLLAAFFTLAGRDLLLPLGANNLCDL